MIKNPKLRHTVRGKTRRRHPLKDSMNESGLFPQTHPATYGSKYAKGVELPDPALEPLEPQDEDDAPPPSETAKAIAMLEEMTKAKAEAPDTTGKLEGKFKVSLEKMIAQLNRIVSAEYSQWMRWYHYAIILHGHCRDALADHFYGHAEEELAHAKAVAMRVVGLGGYPATAMEHPEPLHDTEEILQELLRREQEGMQLYREIHALCGDNEGTRQILEGNMGQEQEHIDDLWRFLKHPELIKGRPTGIIDHEHEARLHGAEEKRFRQEAKAHKDQWDITGYSLAMRAADSHGKAREANLVAAKDASRAKVASNLSGLAYDHGQAVHEHGLSKANVSSGRDTMKPEKRKISEYEHTFARRPQGVAGVSTPDLPERGFDWHDEYGGPKPPPPTPEDEKEQEEAEAYFKPPPNPLKISKPKPSPQIQEAQKALAGAPQFFSGPVMQPRAVDFLLEHGFTPEEIASGEANMTPRMRALYNRNLLSQVRKSISDIGARRR